MALRRRPAGGGVKSPRGALVEACRAERRGKGGIKAVRWGPRETNASEPLMKCREDVKTSKPGFQCDSGMSLAGARLLARRCPACRRREPGLRLLHGTWEGVCR